VFRKRSNQGVLAVTSLIIGYGAKVPAYSNIKVGRKKPKAINKPVFNSTKENSKQLLDNMCFA